MLFGAEPTLKSFEFNTGSPPPSSDNLNCEIISRRSVHCDQIHPLHTVNTKTLTDRENSDDSINSHADHPLALIVRLISRIASDKLYTDVDRCLLPEPNDLRACSPVPTDESLVSSCGNKILGRKRDSPDAVEMAC